MVKTEEHKGKKYLMVNDYMLDKVLDKIKETIGIAKRLSMWQLATQLFASFYIWLAYIFEASYSTLVTSVRRKLSVDESELKKEGGVRL